MEGADKKDNENENKKKKPFFDYARRSLDICAVCKN